MGAPPVAHGGLERPVGDRQREHRERRLVARPQREDGHRRDDERPEPRSVPAERRSGSRRRRARRARRAPPRPAPPATRAGRRRRPRRPPRTSARTRWATNGNVPPSGNATIRKSARHDRPDHQRNPRAQNRGRTPFLHGRGVPPGVQARGPSPFLALGRVPRLRAPRRARPPGCRARSGRRRRRERRPATGRREDGSRRRSRAEREGETAADEAGEDPGDEEQAREAAALAGQERDERRRRHGGDRGAQARPGPRPERGVEDAVGGRVVPAVPRRREEREALALEEVDAERARRRGPRSPAPRSGTRPPRARRPRWAAATRASARPLRPWAPSARSRGRR